MLEYRYLNILLKYSVCKYLYLVTSHNWSSIIAITLTVFAFNYWDDAFNEWTLVATLRFFLNILFYK